MLPSPFIRLPRGTPPDPAEFLWELSDIHICSLLHQKFQARPAQPTSSLSYKGFAATYDISPLSYPSHLALQPSPRSLFSLPSNPLAAPPCFFPGIALPPSQRFFLLLSVRRHQRPKASLQPFALFSSHPRCSPRSWHATPFLPLARPFHRLSQRFLADLD